MVHFKNYPFAAVVGQETAKKALILALINPKIGGVLLSGEKGTAKSSLVRAAADLKESIYKIEMPLNLTEDRLLGSFDIGEAITKGQKKMTRGLLENAHGQLLYVDEINLLSESMAHILFETSANGYFVIEREGFSKILPSEFILIGTMNPEEGMLASHFLDKFGIFVQIKGETDLEQRKEIIARRLDYEADPNTFIKKYEGASLRLQERIQQASKNLNQIVVSEEHMDYAAELALAGGCQGHRAEIFLLETARALAAWYGEKRIDEAILKEAAYLSLPHRLREAIELESNKENETESTEDLEDQAEKTVESEAQFEVNPHPSVKDGENLAKHEENWEDIQVLEKDILLPVENQRLRKNTGKGKRLKTRAHSQTGRYIKYKFPQGDIKDIAVDATLRNAAMHPSSHPKFKIEVRKADIREKVREERSGVTLMFVVDGSGSMGAQKRMGAVKGAILSMLTDAYQKRDLIGMVAFKGQEAQVLLPITRSVDLAEKHLRQLKTGGQSPLALGLDNAYSLLQAEQSKKKSVKQYLILITDGKANVPLMSEDSLADAMVIGEKIRAQDIETLVLDTEKGFIRYGFAEQLSKKMGAKYINMQDINANEIHHTVKSFVSENEKLTF